MNSGLRHSTHIHAKGKLVSDQPWDATYKPLEYPVQGEYLLYQGNAIRAYTNHVVYVGALAHMVLIYHWRN